MKKLYYILFLVLLQSAVANAQTGWVTKNLDDKLSVKFPIEPKLTTNNNINIYTVKGADSVGYSANFVDLKIVANLDSATLNTMKDNQEFADQMVSGIASAMSKFTFGPVSIAQWKNHTAYYVTGTENTNKNKLFLQMILIGSKIYSFSCLVPASLASKNNEVFFNSVATLK